MSAAKRIETSRAGATRLTGVNTIAVSTRMYEAGEAARCDHRAALSCQALAMAPGRGARGRHQHEARKALQPQS
jgi:hypothetical protein